jgi:dCTP deaminase
VIPFGSSPSLTTRSAPEQSPSASPATATTFEWEQSSNATSGGTAIVDPKNFSNDLFIAIDTAETGRDHIVIPPNSFALAETVETIDVPRDVLAICVGKSTYARCGIIVNVTPLEPEWRGKVTIEISNTTPLPAKIYANEGIAQMIFLRAENVCAVSYADKRGKYQDQTGLTLPRVDGLPFGDSTPNHQ